MVVTSYSKSLIFNCIRVWEYARKTEQLRGLEQYLHQRRVKYMLYTASNLNFGNPAQTGHIVARRCFV
jgi:hypothetical protein